MDLTVVWAFVIAFAVAAYVVMDGFDLGIGILFPLFRVGRERDQAMNAIAPVWDGNETWLVLRGVAFEYRWREPRHRKYWDAGFCLGSAVATFAQGITLGALLQGIEIEGRAYAGGWWDWLTPFSLLVGAGLVVGYALLGAAWLIWKTSGPLQADARRLARRLAPGLVAAIGAVSL